MVPVNKRHTLYIVKVYDHTKYFDQDERQVESYDKLTMEQDHHQSVYWTWMDSNLIHWDKTTAEFGFKGTF